MAVGRVREQIWGTNKCPLIKLNVMTNEVIYLVVYYIAIL
jgi:hypothetical protein